jgi:hypothetical protein
LEGEHELLHAGACASPELDVHGLDRPRLGNQVRCLIVSVARRAPCPDVGIGWSLNTVLKLADAREMPTGRGG